MNVTIPPEFEAFRQQVAAGRYSSGAEVVADALKQVIVSPLARADIDEIGESRPLR
jgi:Arc/MetJ-type ribon-helix-helix transcriptional regulator